MRKFARKVNYTKSKCDVSNIKPKQPREVKTDIIYNINSENFDEWFSLCKDQYPDSCKHPNMIQINNIIYSNKGYIYKITDYGAYIRIK